MPIVGNLSEFPLPEVLLLIGIRTGRLRLLDVPEYGVLDLDISSGEVQTMHIGGQSFNETEKMLDKLSTVVHSQAGMFEFRLAPVSLSPRTQALSIHDLAIQPEIWVEPELNQFFQDALVLLTDGATQDELAQNLGIDPGLVYNHLNHLRMLGLTELLEEAPKSAPVEEAEDLPPKAKEQLRKNTQLLHKSTVFLRSVHIKERIRKLSAG